MKKMLIATALAVSALAVQAKDIVDTAVAAGSFKTLAAALQAAGLVDTLKGKGPFTVFAPTDEAFAKIPKADLDALLKDKAKLTAVLTYHVVPGATKPRAARKAEVATLQGQSLLVGFERGTGAVVNQSTANCTAVRTTNGTVWIIDSVLLPQFR
jgi:uncharacterized surface protein with fasciclin (FAS1) repeats